MTAGLSPATGQAHPPVGPAPWLCHAAALSAALAEVSIMTRWVGGFIGPVHALLSHLAVTVALALVLALLCRASGLQAAIMAALLLLLGPLGSFVILIARLDRPDEAPAGNAAWRGDRDDAARSPTPPQVETVFASLRQGRRPRAFAHWLASYETVFLTGDLRAQQQALAAISRAYRPEMLPALRIALGANRPAVRVQAAAVFARLRGSFDERAKAALREIGAPCDNDARIRLADECRAVADSGFVGPEIAEKLRAASEEVLRIRSADLVPLRVGQPRVPAATTAPPRLKRHACGGVA